MNINSEQEDYVSSVKAANIFDDRLKHEQTRRHIISIVSEYADSVPFMEKVQKYAGNEIDSRIFRNVKFWGGTIVTLIITAVASALVGHYFH